MEFKKYTKKDVADFCEENFIEGDDEKLLYNFVKKFTSVNLSMKSGAKMEDGNRKGILVISINEGEGY